MRAEADWEARTLESLEALWALRSASPARHRKASAEADGRSGEAGGLEEQPFGI